MFPLIKNFTLFTQLHSAIATSQLAHSYMQYVYFLVSYIVMHIELYSMVTAKQ